MVAVVTSSPSKIRACSPPPNGGVGGGVQGALIIIAFGDRLRVFIGRYAQNLAKSLRQSQTSNHKPYLKSDFFINTNGH